MCCRDFRRLIGKVQTGENPLFEDAGENRFRSAGLTSLGLVGGRCLPHVGLRSSLTLTAVRIAARGPGVEFGEKEKWRSEVPRVRLSDHEIPHAHTPTRSHAHTRAHPTSGIRSLFAYFIFFGGGKAQDPLYYFLGIARLPQTCSKPSFVERKKRQPRVIFSRTPFRCLHGSHDTLADSSASFSSLNCFFRTPRRPPRFWCFGSFSFLLVPNFVRQAPLAEGTADASSGVWGQW